MVHALHYSSAVFEGKRCYKTKDGPAIFRLKDNTKRLFDSGYDEAIMLDWRGFVSEGPGENILQ